MCLEKGEGVCPINKLEFLYISDICKFVLQMILAAIFTSFSLVLYCFVSKFHCYLIKLLVYVWFELYNKGSTL